MLTLLIPSLVVSAIGFAPSRVHSRFVTRDVTIDISGTSNTPSKRSVYHVDLVRDDGYHVGYGFDLNITEALPDGQRWHRTPTWNAVATDWGYHIEVKQPYHPKWVFGRETIDKYYPWVYTMQPLYCAW